MKEEALIIKNITKILKDESCQNLVFFPWELTTKPSKENYLHIHGRFEIRIVFKEDKDTSCNYNKIEEILLTPSQVKHLTISNSQITRALTIRLGLGGMLYFRGKEPIMEMTVSEKLAQYGFSVECFLKLFNDQEPQNINKHHALHGLVFFLSSLSMLMEKEDCRISDSPGQKIKAYIHQNFYDQDFTINKLSLWCNHSPNYIQQIFKSEFNTTPRNYLINYRLQQAKNLLQQNKYSVKEVAYNTGWNCQHYFANCYKKRFGISPSKEKNLSQN